MPHEAPARAGVPVAPSLATNIVDLENADLFGSEDFDRVFRPRRPQLQAGEDSSNRPWRTHSATLRPADPDEFYEG